MTLYIAIYIYTSFYQNYSTFQYYENIVTIYKPFSQMKGGLKIMGTRSKNMRYSANIRQT